MDSQQFHVDGWTERLFRDHEPTYRYEGQTGDAFDAWQSDFRRELREVLGFPVIEERGPVDPDPRQVSTESADGFERQKWCIRTEPEFDLPFYLLLPADAEPPYPVVLTIHGHNPTGKEPYVGLFEDEEEREMMLEGDRDVAVQAVERGYAAIAPDIRGIGELADPEDRAEGTYSCRALQMHAQLFGRTLVGDRAWDVTKLVDFVEDRPELDGDRVGITGTSGGGTVTLFAGAVDERLSPVAPAAYFCTFEDSIAAMRHCACNYLPGVLELGEMADVAGLIAPRPFVAINGAEDDIFPIEGTRRAFDRLRWIYEGAGAGERCELSVGDGGHRYYADGAWPFLEEHL